MRDTTLSRRQFLATGAVVAGYAIAARPVLADAIRTPEDGLATGLVKIPVEGGETTAYFAAPAAAASPPAALVVHEIFGLHEYIRDVCRRLAQAGYFAIAPDLYHRHGDVSKVADVDTILRDIVTPVTDAEVMSDLDATRAWLDREGKADTSRSVITGFCWGGRVVWLYCARDNGVRAGVVWYGRLSGAARTQTPTHPIDLAAQLHAPVLGLYGTEDSGIPLESVEEMRSQLTAAGKSSEIILFPGAPHGFHADYRDSYRSLAASEGWRRMLAWFADHTSGKPPA